MQRGMLIRFKFLKDSAIRLGYHLEKKLPEWLVVFGYPDSVFQIIFKVFVSKGSYTPGEEERIDVGYSFKYLQGISSFQWSWTVASLYEVVPSPSPSKVATSK